MRLKLQVIDGNISVETFSASQGSRRWCSKDGPARHDYFVQGSFSDWALTPLVADPERCGVYRCQGVTGINAKEFFNIVVDGDMTLIVYPEMAGACPGKSIVRGPDSEGSEKSRTSVAQPSD